MLERAGLFQYSGLLERLEGIYGIRDCWKESLQAVGCKTAVASEAKIFTDSYLLVKGSIELDARLIM